MTVREDLPALLARLHDGDDEAISNLAEIIHHALPQVSGQVIRAALAMEPEHETQPEWLWFSNDGPGTVGFGRWPRFPRSAPYVRADLLIALLKSLTKDQP